MVTKVSEENVLKIRCDEELHRRFKSFAALMGMDYADTLKYLLDMFGYKPEKHFLKTMGEKGVTRVEATLEGVETKKLKVAEG